MRVQHHHRRPWSATIPGSDGSGGTPEDASVRICHAALVTQGNQFTVHASGRAEMSTPGYQPPDRVEWPASTMCFLRHERQVFDNPPL
ncbi:hypothetical protein [Micromonospora chersina]|uniref:hypothetical protein n=1 Tax=Micromonospora chersina TaxID=47854 RepID=UPI0033A0D263